MQFETLTDLLPASAARFGDRMAVHFPDSGGLEAVSYADLDLRTARVRDGLAEHVREGAFVVLCGENSIEWIVGLFGILRAGAIPVPLDPDLAADQLEPILDELDATGVLADRELLDRFARIEGLRLALEDLGDIDGAASSEGDRRRSADDVAVQVYTAGTTGLPKGVQLSHRNLVANIDGALGAIDLRDDDSLMLVLPLYHAFPLLVGCFAPLTAGVRLELEKRPLRLARRLRDDRPTLLIGVPALFETMLRQVRRGAGRGWRRYAFEAGLTANRLLIRATGLNAAKLVFRPVHASLGGRLRVAVSGAAPLSPRVLAEAYTLGLPLLQGYGMSEAGPVISVQRFDSRRFWMTKHYWRQRGSVGAPLHGITLDIVPVEDAEEEGVGELVVGGPSVMKGYYRRDEETQEALQDGRLHTGDLARIDSDGVLWISGRTKLAVSTPEGKLVHLERVESALAEVPEVEQLVVSERTEPRWHFAAVVYPSADASPPGASPAAVRERVEAAVRSAANSLRPHERPSSVQLVDEPLPTTRIGKVRREAVPQDDGFDVDRWRERIGAPRGRTEDEQRAIDERIGHEGYRLPLLPMAVRLSAGLLPGRVADIGSEGQRLFEGRETRVEGLEHVPRSGTFILVMNHYERDGLRVWWPALLVSAVLRDLRGEAPPIRWLMADRFYGVRIGGVPIPVSPVSWALRLLSHGYDQIRVARPTSMSTSRSAAVRQARASLRGEGTAPRPIGITPEAAAGFGPELFEAPSNSGMAIAMLSDGETPVLPVVVFEDGDALIARFGEPYTMEWRGRDDARAHRAELVERVMRSLAALLPDELRGPYR